LSQGVNAAQSLDHFVCRCDFGWDFNVDCHH
jgi:hypothetical protein